MLGIDLDRPGYKTIRMKPEVGYGVTWAKGHYDSIHGRIASDWKLDGDTFRWTVEIPANTTATLHLPAAQLAEVTENGRPIEKTPGLTFLRQEEGRVILRAGSGVYEFTVAR